MEAKDYPMDAIVKGVLEREDDNAFEALELIERRLEEYPYECLDETFDITIDIEPTTDMGDPILVINVSFETSGVTTVYSCGDEQRTGRVYVSDDTKIVIRDPEMGIDDIVAYCAKEINELIESGIEDEADEYEVSP